MELDWYYRKPIICDADPIVETDEILCCAAPEPGYRLFGGIFKTPGAATYTTYLVAKRHPNGQKEQEVKVMQATGLDWQKATSCLAAVMQAHETPDTVRWNGAQA